MPRPIKVTVAPVATSTNNISLAQTTAGAGNLLLNGSTAGSLDLARRIAIASTGNLSGVNFTITGLDADGRTVTEVLAGPNNSTVTSVQYYKTVSSIAVSGAVGTNVTVGTSSQFATPIIPLNFYNVVPATIDVECTGTITYTVQEAFNDLLQEDVAVWQNIPNLTSKVITASAPIAINSPNTLNAKAVRLVSNSYSTGATVKLFIIQSDASGDDS